MPLTALLRASPVASRGLGWLTWLSALLVAALFVGGQVTYNDAGHLTESYAATLGRIFLEPIRIAAP